MTDRDAGREFTGRHMLVIMVAFFGVVIAVNLTMAFFARSSWTGVVVQNIYVASQQFNRKAAEGRAQAALGWQTELTLADRELRYRLRDGDGKAVAATQVVATFRRATHTGEDQDVTLTRQPDMSFAAPVELHDGLWIVEVESEAGLGHPYRDVRRLNLRNGAIE